VSDAALAVDGLRFAYERGRPALDGVSFEVAFGRFTALLGPNGAGKTTLLALLTRLFRARDGRIHVAGRDLDREPLAALAALGVVFQQPSLDLDLTVRQNLAYAGRLQGLSEARLRRRIDAVTVAMGVADRLASAVRTLSGGLRRRVEIARALLHEPRILVLDEPTVGLDIDSRRDIVETAHRLAAEGLGVLWTTHLVDEVRPGDDLVVLHAGRVAGRGGFAEVVGEGGDLGAAFQRLTAA
jgi:ABC-2 type transport system ATP-binding protein